MAIISVSKARHSINAIDGCEQQGNRSPNVISYMDSNCQHILYDTSIDDYDNFTRTCNGNGNGGESFGKDKIYRPHLSTHYTYNIKFSPKPPENDVSMILSHIQITEVGDKLGQIMLIMDQDVHWKDNRIQLVVW